MANRTVTCMVLAVVVVGAVAATPLLAQQTLDFPVGEIRALEVDSTQLSNDSTSAAVLYNITIDIEEAAWVRLYFNEEQTNLPAGSYLVITSNTDGSEQVLDSEALEEWSFTSAYFNGPSVEVELIGAPNTANNHMALNRVAFEEEVLLPTGSCGICGPDTRVPSDELYTGRLLPAGCTASVWTEDSCLVSAGHCIGGQMVIQFNVPPSQSNCNLRHPPASEQFPITQFEFTNGGVGDDWAVMKTGTNNLGEKAFERYGEMRPITANSVTVGDDVQVVGYGVDDQCVRSQVQQIDTDPGSVTQVFTQHFRYTTDATFGNSGSSVIRDDEIVGIATHCPCANTATRFDHPDFIQARNILCGCAGDANLDGMVNLTDVLKVLANWGRGDVPADVNGDGIVDFGDLLVVLANWGCGEPA